MYVCVSGKTGSALNTKKKEEEEEEEAKEKNVSNNQFSFGLAG
jgi:hypothetical protein